MNSNFASSLQEACWQAQFCDIHNLHSLQTFWPQHNSPFILLHLKSPVSHGQQTLQLQSFISSSCIYLCHLPYVTESRQRRMEVSMIYFDSSALYCHKKYYFSVIHRASSVCVAFWATQIKSSTMCIQYFTEALEKRSTLYVLGCM